MNRLFLLACSLVSLGAAAAPEPPAAVNLTESQIVDRNVAARGGLEAWRKVSTLTMSGKLEAGGKANTPLPFVMKMKRPHMSRMEITFQEQTALQVYDGTQGWKVRPFLNRNEVEPYTPAEAKSAAAWEELDGPLVDYSKKGTKVELAGTELVEGKSAYKLKLTMKGGEQRNLWIDAKTFLELKVDGQPRKMDGKMKKVSIYFRDYRPEAGLVVPHVLETVVEGVKQGHKLTIQKVVVNEAMQDALFQKPQLAMTGAPRS
jgi:outer membrane lipoprotein-sorting protein